MRTGKGFGRVLKATRYSLQGLKAAWASEAAVRQELTVALILLPIALVISKSLTQFLLLICSLFLVVITELLNTAIEAIVDRVGTDYHELSGKAKDVGSAAVFVSLMLVCIVWGASILDYLF